MVCWEGKGEDEFYIGLNPDNSYSVPTQPF